MEFFYVLIWGIIGSAGFIFWWTNQWDFTVRELPIAVLVSIIGPASFVIGWCIHGGEHKPFFTNPFNSKVLISCRSRL